MELAVEAIKDLRPLGKVSIGTFGGRPVLVKRVTNLVEYHIEVAMLKVTTGHPHLLGLLGVCSPERLIVTPYYPGGDLSMRTKARLHSEIESVHLLKGLCSGLAMLHSRCIMHRDVKAANGVVNEHGSAILIDMGTCCAEGSPLAKRRRGTIGWAAPELLMSPSYGVKVDVFSIGVLSLFLLTGDMVFGRGAIHDGSAKVYQQRALAGLSGARDLDLSKVSPGYLKGVKGCLAVEPEHRFSVSEAIAAFASSVEEQSRGDVSASLSSPATPSRREKLVVDDALALTQSDACSTATGSRRSSFGSSTSTPEKGDQQPLLAFASSSNPKVEIPKEGATTSAPLLVSAEHGPCAAEPKQEEDTLPPAAWSLCSEATAISLAFGLLATCGVVASIGVGIGAAVAASGISLKSASIGLAAVLCPLPCATEVSPPGLCAVKVAHDHGSNGRVLTAAERAFL